MEEIVWERGKEIKGGGKVHCSDGDDYCQLNYGIVKHTIAKQIPEKVGDKIKVVIRLSQKRGKE